MSTTFNDIRVALLQRIKDNLASIDAAWTEGQNVAWPGVNFSAAGKVNFMAVDVLTDAVDQAAIGSSTRRIEGALDLQFFTVMGKSSDKLHKYLDAAQDLFPMSLVLTAGTARLVFRAPIPRPPQEGDAEFLLGALRCPFFTYA